jgi:uncharacterized membrane protein (DUF2068 family)
MARHSYGVVRLIGAFKLTKATLLLALAVAGLMKTPDQLERRAEDAVAWMGVFPGRVAVTQALQHLALLSSRDERWLVVLVLLYASVFVVEGVGLLKRRRWAEWLTVVVTASFIPVELYELAQRVGAGKIVALVLNIAIVAYLIWRLIEERRGIGGRLPQAFRLT